MAYAKMNNSKGKKKARTPAKATKKRLSKSTFFATISFRMQFTELFLNNVNAVTSLESLVYLGTSISVV